MYRYRGASSRWGVCHVPRFCAAVVVRWGQQGREGRVLSIASALQPARLDESSRLIMMLKAASTGDGLAWQTDAMIS